MSTPDLNTDPARIESMAFADYKHYLGKAVSVRAVFGFIGDDSVDVDLDPPAIVRVEETPASLITRWSDGWCDPIYEVVLLEPHPALAGVRSLCVYGPSRHLNGKQTESSDIVSICPAPFVASPLGW